jgi:hypothetical protein
MREALQLTSSACIRLRHDSWCVSSHLFRGKNNYELELSGFEYCQVAETLRQSIPLMHFCNWLKGSYKKRYLTVCLVFFCFFLHLLTCHIERPNSSPTYRQTLSLADQGWLLQLEDAELYLHFVNHTCFGWAKLLPDPLTETKNGVMNLCRFSKINIIFVPCQTYWNPAAHILGCMFEHHPAYSPQRSANPIQQSAQARFDTVRRVRVQQQIL